MRARSFATLLILASTVGAEPPKPTIRKYSDAWEFYLGNELVSRYHVGERNSKPFLWPLMAPGGIGVTRDWPMKRGSAGETTDHPHQKSAWFSHGDVIPEGVQLLARPKGVKGVDFWTEGPIQGKISCISVSDPEIKKDRAVLSTRNVWKTAEGRTIVDESREIELIPLDGARLLVFKIVLRPASHAVTFGDTKEGACGVRVHDQLTARPENPKSRITNSLGNEGEKSCWGQKADWCDYSGEIGGKPVGISIFDDATNRFRACWHVRAYGLMAANPFGRRESGFVAQAGTTEPPIMLKPGDEFRVRYGILLHVGDVKSGKVAEHYRKFLALAD